MSLAPYENPALTAAEHHRLAECERVIERGLATFVEVGNALLEIRDSRLYRARFGTFEDYCREQWGFSGDYARLQIRAAATVSCLAESPTIVGLLPANEAQARPLTALPPDQQPAAWCEAVETAPNGKVTAAHVESVVRELLAGRQAEADDRRAYRAEVGALVAELNIPPIDEAVEHQRVQLTHGFYDALKTLSRLPAPADVLDVIPPYQEYRMADLTAAVAWLTEFAGLWEHR